MPEVYNKENIEFHKNNTSNPGSKNGRARLTEKQVIDIRMKRKQNYDKHVVYETYKEYLTYRPFEQVWYYQNWNEVLV